MRSIAMPLFNSLVLMFLLRFEQKGSHTMELLKLCDGDTAALLELSSLEKELADLFSNISGLGEILSALDNMVLRPIISGSYITLDAGENVTTGHLKPSLNDQINSGWISSELFFQFRCLSVTVGHFIDNCSKAMAIISELNEKQLSSLILLFASNKDEGIIPVISGSFKRILDLIINTYIIISNMKQFSSFYEDYTWSGDKGKWISIAVVGVMKDIDEKYQYFCTLVSDKEVAKRANVSSHQEITPTQKLTLKVNSNKKLSVIHGDLCTSSEEYDLVVCSAYKNAYAPSRGTLINGLLYNKNISVYLLSKDREINLSDRGAWLSRETNMPFHRIACVELLDYQNRDKAEIVNYKSIFSTLYYILEQASLSGIPIRRIALPLLGTGCQNIDVSYIASPLIHYCIRALKNLDGLEEIVFWERNNEKAEFLAHLLQELYTSSDHYDVMISYSTKQLDEANAIYHRLISEGISTWMAPQSIPTGSAYDDEIPKAINNSDIVLLLLTNDSVKSFWVPKEIGSSIGAKKIVMPFQFGDIILNNKFSFLLADIQIKRKEKDGHVDLDYLVANVRDRIDRLCFAIDHGMRN